MQEKRLHLVDAAGRDKDEVEDGEEPELKVKGSVANHPKGEAAEERRKDVQIKLVPYVVLS